MKDIEYVLSLSYGKDSLACLFAIEQLGWPLDRIVHAEVWATDDIPADLPPMVEFKAKADAYIKERWGIEVEHVWATAPQRERERERERESSVSEPTKLTSTTEMKVESSQAQYTVSPCSETPGATAVSRSRPSAPLPKQTYEKIFYRKMKRRGGGAEDLRLPDAQRSLVQLRPQESSTQQITGWATRWSPYCTGELKGTAIRKSTGFPSQFGGEIGVRHSNKEFSSGSLAQGAKKNIVQYLGIAADEPERIERHTKPGIMLPLVEIGWDEAYCRRLCEENGLLSPIYTTASRGGCWFCHNQSVDQLRLLRKNYPDLWALLLKWDADSPVSFKPDGHTVHDYDRRFFAEDLNLVPSDRRFRWKKLEEDEVVEAMENYAPLVGSAALGAPKEE